VLPPAPFNGLQVRYDILYIKRKFINNDKFTIMGKGRIGGMLLAGLAAYGIYKFSKMSENEKRDLVQKGKKLFADNLGNLKSAFAGKDGMANANMNS
jgi:hypothetical protein